MSESLTSTSDFELLKQFARARDESVFAELVRRHGQLVMSVCLRVLRNRHDAEDAFQATFLVLAQKCRSIRKREALPSWLCGVAYRLSMNLERKLHRRDVALEEAPPVEQFSDLGDRFDQQVIDEELYDLPRKYREVLILHYLNGQSSRQIAEELGTSQGTVDGRIKRGRQELRVRLAKRGVALMTALVAVQLSGQQASAMMSPSFVASTVASATQPLALCSSPLIQLAGTELMKASFAKSLLVTCTAVAVVAVAAASRPPAAAQGLGSTGLVLSSVYTQDSESRDDGSAEIVADPLAPDRPLETRDSPLVEQNANLTGKLQGGIKLEVNPDTNTILIRGGTDDVKKLQRVLSDLMQRDTSEDLFAETPVLDPAEPEVIQGRIRNNPTAIRPSVVHDRTTNVQSIRGPNHGSILSSLQIATATIGDDDKITISVPNGQAVPKAYSVQVPVQIREQDGSGKVSIRTTHRTETRVRMVVSRSEIIYERDELQIETVAGDDSPDLSGLAKSAKTPVIVLHQREKLVDAQRELLNPSLLVITLPDRASLPLHGDPFGSGGEQPSRLPAQLPSRN